MSPPTCPSASCRVLVSGFQDAYSIALDGRGAVFVSHSAGQLDRIELATGRRTTVASGLGNLRGVTTDGAGNVYVADFGGSVIEVDGVTGAHRKFAFGLGEGLLGLAYGNGHLYAGSESGPWDITDTPHKVVDGDGWTSDLAVAEDGEIYESSFIGTVSRVDPMTGAVHVLASDQYEPQAVQVATNGVVYFAAGGTLHAIDTATGRVSPDIRLGATDDLFDFGLGVDKTSVALNGGQLWEITGYNG
ncbi:hypothetical protein [Kutzneria sp. NPDC052558]|uniref:hypothetical protein n=1 Tax=Kutzneria sp. NPDC052558 TaxID=3364121 RepID=UPI0037CA7A7F